MPAYSIAEYLDVANGGAKDASGAVIELCKAGLRICAGDGNHGCERDCTHSGGYATDCRTFKHNPCTQAQYAEWATATNTMGFSDFRAEDVNWNKPIAWRGSGGCTLDPDGGQDGCLLGIEGGYAIVLGFGAFFTIFTVLLTWLEQKVVGGRTKGSEHFNTAGRNVKIGLTGSVIVSQWTWAATLLQSSNVAWNFGISGPFWYAAGATIQVLLFGILAIEIKRKCPNAHTMLEIVDARWGKVAHLTFLVFAFMTNMLVTGQLLLGGAAVINAASGMDKALCCFLMPWGVIFYTVMGGLKATFMAGYIHTSIIMAGLCTMMTAIYMLGDDVVGGQPLVSDPLVDDGKVTVDSGGCKNLNYLDTVTDTDYNDQCSALGSAGAMWERLAFIITQDSNKTGTIHYVNPEQVNRTIPEGARWLADGLTAGMEVSCDKASFAHHGPAASNKGGSYLTMMSYNGFMFGVINTVGNFGTVFVDQSYWQSAIAASPASAHKGYLLGGLVWFTIPFALATSLGLGGIATNAAIYPGDSGAGLVPPATATVVIGQGGGILMIIMLFMAITSTGSAECIAVSSLIVYDVYRKYFNPEASGARILLMSRIVCAVFGIIMGVIGVILNVFTVTDASFDADTCSYKANCGAEGVNISLGWVYQFMGNAIGSAVLPIAWSITWKDCSAVGAIVGAWGGLIGAIITWISIAGAKFCEVNYHSLFDLEANLGGNLVAILLSGALCWIISKIAPQNYNWDEMNKTIKLVENDKFDFPEWELSEEYLTTALTWSYKYGVSISLFLVVVWPLCIAMPMGVLPKGVYALWVAVAFAWGWLGTIVIILMPLWENSASILNVLTCKFLRGAAPATTAEPAKASESA
jgi:Na+/proline symporter